MSYPTLCATRSEPPKLGCQTQQMIRIIRLLIENEGIRESNGRQLTSWEKLFVPRLQEVWVKHVWRRYSFMPTTNILRPLSSTTRHQPVSKWQR